MDYGKVLKRSWHMVTRYRALWIFGIVLVLLPYFSRYSDSRLQIQPPGIDLAVRVAAASHPTLVPSP
jgi:hypothetical protein